MLSLAEGNCEKSSPYFSLVSLVEGGGGQNAHLQRRSKSGSSTPLFYIAIKLPLSHLSSLLLCSCLLRIMRLPFSSGGGGGEEEMSDVYPSFTSISPPSVLCKVGRGGPPRTLPLNNSLRKALCLLFFQNPLGGEEMWHVKGVSPKGDAPPSAGKLALVLGVCGGLL